MRVPPLRSWQEHALEQYWGHDRQDFLVEATPGSGKTRLMSEISKRLLDAGLTERIIVVVPTSALRKQTADAFFEATGLQLAPEWEISKNGFPNHPFVGIVVTYQAVDAFPEIYRKVCSERSSIVFFDEIHHAGDNKSWGASLKRAFDPASRKVLLSGTPFRSDNDAIPFVRYLDGVGKSDAGIGYGEALAEGIVRSVFFPRCGGKMEWMDKRGKTSATFNDDLDREGQSHRLKTALSADGGHLITMLSDAHADLQEKRLEDPDAGGVVVAMDQSHAHAIARILRNNFGAEPIVVTSDDPSANDKITMFTKGTMPWIVAVKMVSEGVDIPRLRVGAYATNVVTEMFFRQFVGRIVRIQQDHEDHSATLFIPDDERLRKYAMEIKEQREAVFKLKDEPGEGSEGPGISAFAPIASSMTIEGMIVVGEEEITPEELKLANEYRLKHRETASLPAAKVALLLRSFKGARSHAIDRKGTTDFFAEENQSVPLYDALKKWREVNKRLVAQIHYKTGAEYYEINLRLNDLIEIRSMPACADLQKLQQRAEWARKWLNGDFIPGGIHA